MRDHQFEAFVMEAASEPRAGSGVGQFGIAPPQLACSSVQVGGECRVTAFARCVAAADQAGELHGVDAVAEVEAVAATIAAQRIDCAGGNKGPTQTGGVNCTVLTADGGGSGHNASSSWSVVSRSGAENAGIVSIWRAFTPEIGSGPDGRFTTTEPSTCSPTPEGYSRWRAALPQPSPEIVCRSPTSGRADVSSPTSHLLGNQKTEVDLESAPIAERYDVIVVGAGVAGLATAVVLGRYGIATLVVERRSGPPTLPRATVISTRTMELLRGWGLEAEVLARGIDAELCPWECERWRQRRRGAPTPSASRAGSRR